MVQHIVMLQHTNNKILPQSVTKENINFDKNFVVYLRARILQKWKYT